MIDPKATMRRDAAQTRAILRRALLATFTALATLALFAVIWPERPVLVATSAAVYVPSPAPQGVAAVYVAPSPRKRRRPHVRRRVAQPVLVAQTCPCTCESGLVKTAGK
jgi:hypothetical protein